MGQLASICWVAANLTLVVYVAHAMPIEFRANRLHSEVNKNKNRKNNQHNNRE